MFNQSKFSSTECFTARQFTTLISSIAICVLSSVAVLAQSESEEVNVYSARQEALIKPILDEFTKTTGVKTNLVTGKADALLSRLRLEGAASPADVFITTDAGRLHRAKQANVLQAIDSEILTTSIPPNMRDTDNQWFGLSQRARPIFYVKSKVDPKELSTYEDLTDDKWQGKICIRSSSNIYNQSLVASMLDAMGEEATQNWLNGLVKNFARSPVGGDTDQLKAAAAGQCDIAIANTYYYGRLLNSQNDDDRATAQKLAIFWPNQSDRGAHVNVSGAGVTKYAKNTKNAVKLIEFLASVNSQTWYSAANNEYPVVRGADVSATLRSWGKFKQDSVNLSILGSRNRAAVEMMDRASWK